MSVERGVKHLFHRKTPPFLFGAEWLHHTTYLQHPQFDSNQGALSRGDGPTISFAGFASSFALPQDMTCQKNVIIGWLECFD